MTSTREENAAYDDNSKAIIMPEESSKRLSYLTDAAVKKPKIGSEENDTPSILTKTHAYGKLILFGEHFVVYGVPALVGAVAAYTDCSLEIVNADEANNKKGEDDHSKGENDTWVVEIVDNRPAVPNYKVKKAEEGKKAIDLVFKHFKLLGSDKKVILTFGGNLCCASGIGASAAQVVALARAIKETIPEFSELTDEEINAAGFEGEKGYHGTPSGIDNTASTYGGLLKFQRTDGEPIFEKKKIKEPIRIVYASTGITSSTTEVVGDVRTKKEADPAWFEDLLNKYCDIASKGEKALNENDVNKLGRLMNENHKILQDLTVSCDELDLLVNAARKAGAVGAKMSGTGRGGLILALTPTDDIQNAVAESLEKLAPQVWKTFFQ